MIETTLRKKLALHYLDMTFEICKHSPYPITVLVRHSIKDSCVHDIQHADHALHRERNISMDITVVNPAKPFAKASKAGAH